MLNQDFSRILALLRKERGYSQKKAAADLGISQALLSHYEKGIRECGLDFVVRAADYYQVSCDYLLGRTPHRSGAVLNLEGAPAGGKGKKGAASPAEYDRRVLGNSLHIVFSLLKKINSEALTKEAYTYLAAGVYRVFRAVYSANPQNPQGAFQLDGALYGALTQAAMALAEARATALLRGKEIPGSEGVRKEALPALTPESLEKEFPSHASSLLDLIRSAEQAAGHQWGG